MDLQCDAQSAVALAGQRISEIDLQGGAQNALAQASVLGNKAMGQMGNTGDANSSDAAQYASAAASDARQWAEGSDVGEIVSDAWQAGADSDATQQAAAMGGNAAQYASAAASDARQWAEGSGVGEVVSNAWQAGADSEVTQQAAAMGGSALEAARNVDMGAVGDAAVAFGEQAVSKVGSMILDSGMLESGLQVHTPCAYLL